jgi:hypothetical protein
MTKRKSVLRISSKGFIRAYICVNVWEGFLWERGFFAYNKRTICSLKSFFKQSRWTFVGEYTFKLA